MQPNNSYLPIEPSVYDKANQLYNSGFHITSMQNYTKQPTGKKWNKKRYKPDVNMTGVGIVTGTINNYDNFNFVIDIDIQRLERREKVYQEIYKYFNQINKSVYIETTPSGCYHLIAYYKDSITTESKVFKFSEVNDSAKHKDAVEFLVNLKQCLIAPSKAINKAGEIGEYKQISEVGLLESAVLNEHEIDNLLKLLDSLSLKYSSQKFQHKHITSPEHRQELKKTNNYLRSQGYITAPLFNGERYCNIPDWKKGVPDSVFEVDNLTGIVLKLGKQSDGFYLNVIDIDGINKFIIEQLKSIFGQVFYYESSVSGGYHIIFKTDKLLDINNKWELTDGSTLEILCTGRENINIAPTSSYIKKYEFSGYPKYDTSVALSDIKNITTVEAEKVRAFITNSFKSARKGKTFNNAQYTSNSKEDKDIRNYMRQYDTIDAINRQIKIVFPNVIELLNFLEIDHSNKPEKDYINFFSLYTKDGYNPDAILFHNNNENLKNKWSGYSVEDFHSKEVMSFGQYLCKYSQERFDKLMEQIGYRKINNIAPITTISKDNVFELQCNDKYITQSESDYILEKINEHSKIIITAPTGIGKTEIFYQLAKQKKIKMILALAYTSQVEQGKEKYNIDGVLQGLCSTDSKVPVNGSIFMTYDKAAIVEARINPSEYIMIIDEAHNLVNQYNFRNEALKDLKRLAAQCKAIVYITATPEYINFNDIDLTIKIKHEKAQIKYANVVKYNKIAKVVVSNVLINQHIPGTIDVVYARDIKQLREIEELIKDKVEETQLLFSDIKNSSNAYENLSKFQTLLGNEVFNNDGVLLTTNLIVDGVNILDKNIGNIYLINPECTTDLIQFPSRFRNGYKKYFIFISGNLSKSIIHNRQQLIAKYYSITLLQKYAYDKMINISKNFFQSYNLQTIRIGEIFLKEQFKLLDNGEISEELLFKNIQAEEVRYMRSDVTVIKAFMEKPDYNYNFQISEVDYNTLIQQKLTSIDIESAENNIFEDDKELIKRLFSILTETRYNIERQEILMDYVKKKHKEFKSLPLNMNINQHRITKKYNDFLGNSLCSKLLYRYCTGLELGVDPLSLVRYKDNIIYSIKRALNNISLEKSGNGVKKDDKFLRFVELRNCIRNFKQKLNTSIVTLNSKDVLNIAKEFNSRYSAVYNERDTKSILIDLNDIFDIEVKIQVDNQIKYKLYIIKDEWNPTNIHGINFTGVTH